MLNRSSFQQTPTFSFFYSAKHHYIATSTMALKANHKTYRSHTVSYICFWKWCHQWCLSYCKSGTFNVWGLCSFYFVIFWLRASVFLNISCYIGAGQTSGESIKFPTILTDLNIKTTSFGRYLSRFFHQHSSIWSAFLIMGKLWKSDFQGK